MRDFLQIFCKIVQKDAGVGLNGVSSALTPAPNLYICTSDRSVAPSSNVPLLDTYATGRLSCPPLLELPASAAVHPLTL